MNDGITCSSNFIIPRVQFNGTLVPWNIFGYWFALVTWLGLMTDIEWYMLSLYNKSLQLEGESLKLLKDLKEDKRDLCPPINIDRPTQG